MGKSGKKYREARGQVEARSYGLEEALALMKKVAFAKFDESVDLAILLGVDPKHADQMVRGTVVLPHGTGKSAKVLVIASGEKMKDATDAGADHVGGAELVKKIQEGWMDFDVAIAHPSMMRVVGKLGKILGPQGKMPSPKAGTVIAAIGQAVTEFKAGKIEFRNDAGGNVHAPVGKLSFEEDQLAGNIQAFLDHIWSLRPSTTKGTYVQKASVSSTMGPGIDLAVGS